MKTKKKDYYDFGSGSLYQLQFNHSKEEESLKETDNQQFIVPWQLNRTKNEEFLIK